MCQRDNNPTIEQTTAELYVFFRRWEIQTLQGMFHPLVLIALVHV